jgi:hypothetical protein
MEDRGKRKKAEVEGGGRGGRKKVEVEVEGTER